MPVIFTYVFTVDICFTTLNDRVGSGRVGSPSRVKNPDPVPSQTVCRINFTIPQGMFTFITDYSRLIAVESANVFRIIGEYVGLDTAKKGR